MNKGSRLSKAKQPGRSMEMPSSPSAEPNSEPPIDSGVSRKRRKEFTLKEKMAILHDLDTSTIKRKALAKKWGVTSSLLSTILQQRERICQLSKLSPDRRRLSSVNVDAVDAAVASWLKLVRQRGEPITELQITDKANELAGQLGMQDSFDASSGWLVRFMRENNMSGARRGRRRLSQWYSSRRTGEDVASREHFRSVLSKYYTRDTYIVFETALLFQLPPGQSLSATNARFTVLLCCNADGSEKRLPVIVCDQLLPSGTATRNYRHHPSGRLTPEVLGEYLRWLDRDMTSDDRRVLVLAKGDCDFRQANVQRLKNVRLEVIPMVKSKSNDDDDITSPTTCQSSLSMDSGIVSSFKTNYRRAVLRRIIESSDGDPVMDIDVDEAVDGVVSAWNAVTPAIIELAWRRADFSEMLDEDDHQIEKVVTKSDEDLWRQVSLCLHLPSSATFSDYVSCDNWMSTWAEPMEVNLVGNVAKSPANGDDGNSDLGGATGGSGVCDIVDLVDEEIDCSVAHSLLTAANAFTCVETLRSFLSRQDEIPGDVHDDLDAIEDFIALCVLDDMTEGLDDDLVTTAGVTCDRSEIKAAINSSYDSDDEPLRKPTDIKFKHPNITLAVDQPSCVSTFAKDSSAYDKFNIASPDLSDPDVIYALNLVDQLKKLSPKHKELVQLRIKQVMSDIELCGS